MASAILIAGCEAESGLGYTVRALPVSSDEQAVTAAQDAFREHFRIEHSSMGPAVLLELRSLPAEGTQQGGTGRLGDEMLSAPARVRRVAMLRLARRGEQLRAFCQVRQQRLDTSEMEMFRRDQQRLDVPTETPIDQQGATREQEAVWTDVGRDTALEREIIASLIERLSATLPGGTPPEQPR
jgi:hypothetical protein